ncbi:hypothetical protein EJ110_NYTH24853 [Nymphaea thermarum]|nr:hypothetical protein EJ110_NYTH24853 [Nymphaea thermarum]
MYFIKVNGVNLTEVDGGELAITNLNSCNGPDFVLLLHFVAQAAGNSGGNRIANARIKCVYFPILEGKESIERILEELDEKGCGIKENFDNFSRVSIRRLGRLLPDARWVGFPNENCYVGFQDSKPLDCPEENGCLLEMNDGNSSLDIRGSKWFPVGLIDSGKFQLLDSTKWHYQLEKKRQNAPARIDILDSEQCQLLGIDGALPMKDVHVLAGYIPPREIVAVLRPLSFMVSSSSCELEPKFIVKSNLAMKMEITFFDEFKMQKYEGKIQKESKLLLSKSSEASSRSGFDGLYIFSLDGSDLAEGLRNSGIYKFSFFVTSQTCGNLSFCKQREVNVFVEPAGEVGKLELLNHSRLISKVEPLCLRVGTCIEHLSVACFDVYSNRMPFLSIPELYIKLGVKGSTLTKREKLKLSLSSDKMILEIKDLLVKCHDLDLIRPSYEAILEICSHYKSVCVPCQVIPGVLSHVNLLPNLQLESSLRPGDVIHELIFEMLDAYGNHVEKGTETCFELQGLTLQDTTGLKRKVDEHGYANLSGLVKVTGDYGTWGIIFF